MPDQLKASDSSATTVIVERLKATLSNLYAMNEVADNTVVGFHGISEPSGPSDPLKQTNPNGFLKQASELLNDIDHQVEKLSTKLQTLHKIVN
jgi:hypothetical protein